MKSLTSVQNRALRWGAKLSAALVILFLVFSPFAQVLQTPVAEAQTAWETCYRSSIDEGKTPREAEAGCTSLYPVQNTNLVNQGEAVRAKTTTTPDACSLLSPGTYDLCISNLVYGFFVGLGSGFAYAGAYIFNLAVKLSLTSTAYGLEFLSTSWKMVRDIANMAFILILVYIAVNIILQADTAGTMRMLAAVVFIALIINFSFFFTRIVIDAGNIAAIQFYNMLPSDTISQTATAGGIQGAAAQVSSVLGTGADTKDLTASIMNGLQLQTVLSGETFSKFRNGNSFLESVITLSLIYISIGLMLFLLAIMFLFAGVKFIARMVVLWFVIIASPLALIAYAIPNKEVSGYFKKWLDMLFKYSFYPAVFLFMFFIISLVTGEMGRSGGIIAGIFNRADELSGIPGILALIAEVAIRLGIVAAMLYAGLKVAKTGSDYGSTAASWVTGKLAFGLPGLVARNTIGRGAYNLAQREGFKNWAGRSTVGSALRGATSRVGQASFDLRAPLSKTPLKEDFGKAAGKGGYAKKIEEKVKGYEKQGKDLKGDTYDEHREQKRAIRVYEEKNGSGSYDRRVQELTKKLDAAKRRSEEALKEAARTTGDIAKRAKETAKEQKKLADAIEKYDLKPLTEAGKKIVSDNNKKRLEALAARLNKRIGRAEVIGASKVLGLVQKKDTKDKVSDAIKEAVEEERESEGGAEPPTPPSPSGPSPTSGGGGGH